MQPPLIIGGGPAGAAAAATLASAGQNVRVLERTTGPTDKVCGDFLSNRALDALRALGIDMRSLGGVPIRLLRLIHRGKSAETALPFLAMGLSRRRLDAALLQAAASRGAELCRGVHVRRVERCGDGFAVHANADAPIRASSVFLATGKHDMRGMARPRPGGEPLGLKMYYRLAPAEQAKLSGCIELMLLPGGYAGLQMVEDDKAVLCLLTTAGRYRAAGQSWSALLAALDAPHLRERLRGAAPCFDRPLAVSAIPYGYLHRPDRSLPGMFRIGDQACVIPSFAGDGIAIALASGMLAARTWLAGGAASAYHQHLLRRLRTPMRIASLVHYGCITPALQPMFLGAGHAWPGAMRLVATATRIATA